jgi:muconolactone delta-isomerase
MLFSVRLVSRQPHDMPPETWQGLVTEQYHATRSQFEQGKIQSIYREAGVGVLAIYDVASAQEMDQILAALPMSRYFEQVTVHALWDMVPGLKQA